MLEQERSQKSIPGGARRLFPHVRAADMTLWLILCLIIASGFFLRVRATSWGLPYEYAWDEPEIMNPAIRVIRDNVYRPTYFAYGPINAYIHAGWAALSFITAVEEGEITEPWDLQSDWDTGWYWTLSSPLVYRRARLLSAFSWAISAIALAGACRTLGMRWGTVAAVALVTVSVTNFENTTIVAGGSLAWMFIALSFWGASIFLKSGSWRAYWGCFFAAAAAVASKVVFVPVLLVPICALAFKQYEKKRSIDLWQVLLLAAALVAATTFLMFLILLDPSRFLHSISNDIISYGKGFKSASFFVHLRNAILSLLASFDFLVLRATKGTLEVVQTRPDFLLFLLLSIAGIIAAFRKARSYLLLIGLPALVNVWQVSAHTGTFFARNLFLALICCAVLCGFGFEWLVELAAQRMPKRVVGVAVIASLILVIPPMSRIWALTEERAQTVDSRVLAERFLRQSAENGAKIFVASELHWYRPVNDHQPLNIAEGSVLWLMKNPETARQWDYLVLPDKVGVYDSRKEVAEAYHAWNAAVARIPAKTSFPGGILYVDAPTKSPAIKIARGKDLTFQFQLSTSRVYGQEFLSDNSSNAAFLTKNGGLAVKNYWVGTTKVRLSTPVNRIVVKGGGTNPFEQESQPQITIKLFPEGAPSETQPPVEGIITVSPGGVREERATVKLSPGNYKMVVTANNPALRFMTEIAYISFEP
jgi:4-amino-4-deoxy-L-arabinose transferase-like glycosyltransferase